MQLSGGDRHLPGSGHKLERITEATEIQPLLFYFADPIVGAEGQPLRSYYEMHTGAVLVKASKDSAGKIKLLAWNAKEGGPRAL
jgi:hypothetical protein